MKKIFTLFAALAMVMSMFAANIPAGTKLYLTPNSNWKQSNARFAAYFFNGSGNAWASMTKVAGQTDLYEVAAPSGTWTNVIFCRMNPGNSTNNWGNKWNQTGDLIYDGTNNHYKINAGSWDQGTWSKYVTTVTVTIQAENGTVTGLATGGTYDSGSTATLNAVPNDGYEFVNWTVGGKEVSTANPYTFTVNDNITLVANFKEAAAKAYTITTSATNGTVEGAATVVEGESVTLTATANPGYKFVNWTVGGVEVSTDNPYTFVPTEDATVVANFEQLPPETVYFVNAADWTGTINIHAWDGTAPGTAWPGNPATKEDYQIGGHDVYSLTAAAGAYAYVIFNNKIAGKDGGSQTVDLEWTAGKYYVVDDWYTKEEAEEKLASGEPLGLTYNVTVPAGTYACYIAGEMTGWSHQEMTKVDDTHYTITIVGATENQQYKYCSGPSWDYAENIDGGGNRTAHSENDVVTGWAKVYNPNPTVDPDVIACYLMGIGGDWTTGIEMEINPDDANEFILLCQPIAADDQFKFKYGDEWTNEVENYDFPGIKWVDEDGDENYNITLPAGNYNFYFKKDSKKVYIATATDCETEPEYDMEITCTNLKTESEGNMTYFMGSDVTGMEINLTILGFDGKGTYEVEGGLNAGGEWFTLAGTATYDYSEELEADVLVAEVTANGEMSLLITMYKKVLVPTETITVENMTKTIQGRGWAQTLRLDGEHETYGQVTIMVTGCDGTYGTYNNTTVYLNAIELSLTGEGEWKNDGEVDVLEVIGELEDGSKVVKVIGKTPAEEAKEPIELYADVTFTVDEGDLNLVGEAITGEAINLWVAGWGDNGYGEYAADEVWGTIDGVDVANTSEIVTIEQEGLVAYVYAVLEGTDGNIYKLTAGGMAPAWEGGDDEPVEPNETITITANNLTASVPYGGVLLLKANANDADNTQIFLWLVDGDTKGYDEYGYSEYPTGLWPDVENASYGDVNLTLSEDVVAKYYQDGTVDVFEGTFLGDDNNLYILVLRSEAPTVGLENLDTTVAPAKAIVNGQLVIVKDGVQYNAQGAVVK